MGDRRFKTFAAQVCLDHQQNARNRMTGRTEVPCGWRVEPPSVDGQGKPSPPCTIRQEPAGKVTDKATNVTKHEQVKDLFRFVDE